MVLSEAAGSCSDCWRYVRIYPVCSHSTATVLGSLQLIILDQAITHSTEVDVKCHAYTASNFSCLIGLFFSAENVLALHSSTFSGGNGLRLRKLSCTCTDVYNIVVQWGRKYYLKSSVV